MNRAMSQLWGSRTSPGLCAVAGLVVLLAARATPATGRFGEPSLITDGTGRTSQVSFAVDARNVYIANVVDSRLVVTTIGPSSSFETVISDTDGLSQGDPFVESTALGRAYLVFAQEAPEVGALGREVLLADNASGEFRVVENLSQHPGDDFRPRLVLDALGNPIVVWSRFYAATDEVVLYRTGLPEPQVIAEGSYPDIAVDDAGGLHLVFTRDRDLYYMTNRGGGFGTRPAVPVTESPEVYEFHATLAVSPTGEVAVAFQSRGSLLLAVGNLEQGFDLRPPVAEGGVADPTLKRQPGSPFSLIFSLRGDIFMGQADDVDDLAPEVVIASPGADEILPMQRFDLNGNDHLVYSRDGDVFYTHNAPVPTPAFDATPRTGEIPLEVNFADLTEDPVHSWKWDFGDGTTSSKKAPVHVYEQEGSYTVKLEVWGIGGRGELIEEEFIVVTDPTRTMRLPQISAYPGQNEVWWPVLASFEDNVQAFQVAGTFDTELLELRDITISKSYTQSFEPQLVTTSDIEESNQSGTFYAGVLLFLEDVREGNTSIPPTDVERRILNLVFDIKQEAPGGGQTEVLLEDIFFDSPNGRQRRSNFFTIGARTKFPDLTHGILNFARSPDPIFLRSDVDLDGVLSISDALILLRWKFLGDFELKCPDAADHDDSGIIDISDAIAILSFLFLGGPSPMPPYPNPGVDGTPDDLPPCITP